VDELYLAATVDAAACSLRRSGC